MYNIYVYVCLYKRSVLFSIFYCKALCIAHFYSYRLQTGTLTCNIMTFLKCTIQGGKHGEITVDEVPMEQEVATGKISRGPSPAPGPGLVETGSRNVCEFSSAWI